MRLLRSTRGGSGRGGGARGGGETLLTRARDGGTYTPIPKVSESRPSASVSRVNSEHVGMSGNAGVCVGRHAAVMRGVGSYYG